MMKGMSVQLPQPLGTSATPTFAALVGTATNNNAPAGDVGEYLSAALASSSGVALSNGTPSNVVSLVLAPGDWEVSGTVIFVPAGITLISAFFASLSRVSATIGNEGEYSFVTTTGINGNQALVTPIERVSIAVSTTVYLVAQASFTLSTCKAGGVLQARRMR